MAMVNLSALKNVKAGFSKAAVKDSEKVATLLPFAMQDAERVLLSKVFTQADVDACIGRGCHVKDGACECGWWAAQDTYGKVAIVAGGLLLVGSIGYLVFVPPKRATANKAKSYFPRRGKPFGEVLYPVKSGGYETRFFEVGNRKRGKRRGKRKGR